MFSSEPVSRLSMQITRQSRASRYSQRCDPRNPAPPVTTAVLTGSILRWEELAAPHYRARGRHRAAPPRRPGALCYPHDRPHRGSAQLAGAVLGCWRLTVKGKEVVGVAAYPGAEDGDRWQVRPGWEGHRLDPSADRTSHPAHLRAH